MFPVKKRKYAYIDLSGVLLTEFRFDYASRNQDGLFQVKEDCSFYFINRSIDKVIECNPEFDYWGFQNGLCLISRKNKWGAISTDGATSIKPVFDRILKFCSGVAPIARMNDTDWGLINTYGEILGYFGWSYCMSFEEQDGFTSFFDGSKWGFINTSGEVVIEPIFDMAYPSNNFLSVVIDRGIVRYWDFHRNDFLRLAFPIENARPFREGLAAVYSNNKFGYINTTGDLEIELQYGYACSFTSGLGVVAKGGVIESFENYKGGKYGVINRDGHLVVPFKFENIMEFEDGLAEYSARVKSDNPKVGYINSSGEVIWKATR